MNPERIMLSERRSIGQFSVTAKKYMRKQANSEKVYFSSQLQRHQSMVI